MAYSIDSYQTKKGKRYRVRYIQPDGKATTKRGFQRKMDAQQWGDAYVNAAKIDGTYVTREAGAMTVRQIYRQWMEARRPALKASTIATDERIWRTHIEREYGTRMIRTITHAEIQAYISGKASTLSPSTVSKIYGVIKGICDTAVKDHRISKSPADDIILPRREGRRLHRYLTVDQLLAVADEAGHARIQPDSKRAIVLLLGFCGLRWGEMCGLKVKDIDFARRRIHVRRNVTRIGGEWVETTPKSHEMRDVPMPRIVGDALLQATKDKQAGDFAFRSPDGKPPRQRERCRIPRRARLPREPHVVCQRMPARRRGAAPAARPETYRGEHRRACRSECEGAAEDARTPAGEHDPGRVRRSFRFRPR